MPDVVGDVAAGVPAVLHSKDALASRFGRHWSVTPRGDRVIEALGPPPKDSRAHLTRREALDDARRRHLDTIGSRAEAAGMTLSHWRSRLQIAQARFGFGRNPSRILAKAAELRASVEVARHCGEGWVPEIEVLPSVLRGPLLLEPGQAVWRICYTWPVEEGIKVERLAVSSVEIWARSGDCEDRDVGFTYVASGGKKDFSFRFDRTEIGDGRIVTNCVGEDAFLIRAEAERSVAKVAGRLRAVAAQAEAEIAEARRG